MFHILHTKKNPDPCSEGLPQRGRARSLVPAQFPPVTPKTLPRGANLLSARVGQRQKAPCCVTEPRAVAFSVAPVCAWRAPSSGGALSHQQIPSEEGDASSLSGAKGGQLGLLALPLPIYPLFSLSLTHSCLAARSREGRALLSEGAWKEKRSSGRHKRGCWDTSGSCISVVNSSEKPDKSHSS